MWNVNLNLNGCVLAMPTGPPGRSEAEEEVSWEATDCISSHTLSIAAKRSAQVVTRSKPANEYPSNSSS